MSMQTKQTNYERSPSPSPQDVSVQQQQQQQPPRSQLKEYHIPSKDTYKYRSCTHPIEEICYTTDNMELLTPDFKYAMLGFICYKGSNGPSVYSEYPAPSNIVTIEQINGRGGYFLKKTTKAASIYLIWYDRKRNMYMFWGATEKEVRDAMNRLRGRIAKVVLHRNTSNTNTTHQNSTTASRYSNIAESPPPTNANKFK